MTVQTRVRVYPGTDAEARGVVVQDFGDTVGYGLDTDDRPSGEKACRWAVMLDAGDLVLVDNEDLIAD
ncbi:hypothetical protein H7I62_13925 [Mycolicibacterium thermoresistibile]|nr:hypothetical protein [Mycolicibacterium thermoresistibile]